jgi:hypothetical protein
MIILTAVRIPLAEHTVRHRDGLYGGIWTGWLDLLTQLGTTSNYRAVPHLHTFQFSVTHAALTSRIHHSLTVNFNKHVKSFGPSLIPFLPFLLNHLRLPSPELDPILFFLNYFTLRLLFSTPFRQSRSQSYVTTDGQPASLSWCQAPIWDLRPDFHCCHTVASVLMWGVLSGERTGLSFAIAACPRQLSHSWVRVPLDSWPYDHILLSQIRDSPNLQGQVPVFISPKEQGDPVIPPGTGFPFRRLLRLAGLRWRYSNPSPRGVLLTVPFYNLSARTARKTPLSIVKNVFTGTLPSNRCPSIVEGACVAEMCLPTRCLAMGIHVTVSLQWWADFPCIDAVSEFVIHKAKVYSSLKNKINKGQISKIEDMNTVHSHSLAEQNSRILSNCSSLLNSHVLAYKCQVRVDHSHSIRLSVLIVLTSALTYYAFHHCTYCWSVSKASEPKHYSISSVSARNVGWQLVHCLKKVCHETNKFNLLLFNWKISKEAIIALGHRTFLLLYPEIPNPNLVINLRYLDDTKH